MSTIRPLATIAILAGLGIFLAQQINAPKEDANQLTANWGDAPAYDANAATETPGYQTDPLAPPLAGQPIAAPAVAGPSNTKPSVDVPPITPPALATTNPPLGGPGGDLPPLPSLPNEPSSSPAVAPSMPGPPAVSASTSPVTNDPSQEIPLPDTIVEAMPEGIPADQLPNNPLAGLPTSPPAEASRYGAGPAGVPPAMDNATPDANPYQSYAPASESPVPPSNPGSQTTLGQIPGVAEPTFRDALPAINQALERNELTRAHTLLSSWYGDPSLSPVERDKVDTLLSQLAGTVVYSTEHRMEPPYTVKPGDTLETIAQEYKIPWRLLAKINGVPSAEAIQVGQTLKVMRGPFGAVLDAKSSELVLMIDGKYAGKFPVQLSGNAAEQGSWTVTQKLDGSPSPLGGATGKQVVLGNPANTSAIVISAGAGSPMDRGRVTVAASDLEELHDILSVGSEIKIRR